MEVFWFLFGLGVGLLADFLLVLHMFKPIKKRISKLEILTGDFNAKNNSKVF